MKNLILTLILFCTAFLLKAQVQVLLNVDAHPTPELAKWMDRDELAILTVINIDEYMEGRRYRIKATVLLDGKKIVETNNTTSILTLEMGTQTYLADEIIPYNSLVFKDESIRRKILRTGMLPAGSYSFCISLIDLQGTIISNPKEICAPMTITDYQMPELLNPIDNMLVSPNLLPSTIFKWTPVSPQPPATMGVKYLLVVSEINKGQQPAQAFLANHPIIEEEIIAGTQFNWPLDIEAPDEFTQYVWSVKPLSNEDNPFIEEGSGFVSPKTFQTGNMQNKNQNTDDEEDLQDDVAEENNNCDCFDVFANQPSSGNPVLTISRSEPVNNPRKLQINGIIDVRDYFWNCNPNFSQPNQNMSVKIKWNDNHSDNLLNNGPFTHTYDIADTIPEQICVTYTIANSFGEQETLCEKEICIDVPEIVQETNVAAGGTVSPGQSIYAGQHDNTGKGEFEIVTTELEEKPGGRYSGKGTVYINWAKAHFLVEFDSISIDTNQSLVAGKITVQINDNAPTYPQDWAMNVVASSPWLNNVATNIVNWASNVSGQNIEYESLTQFTTPVEMPAGLNFPNGNQFAMTEMVFRYNKSELNLITALNTPPDWGNQQLIGFLAKNIVFHPNGIELPPQKLELVEDVSINNPNNNIIFSFVAPDGSNSGCYIEWDENGYSEFGMQIAAVFTRDWFLPVPDDGTSKIVATLSAVGSDWNDLLFTGNMPEAMIVNSQNMIIEANNINYDMSDVRNPNNILFPDNYIGETSNLFRGFYMEQFNLQLPESWTTNSGGQPQVNIQNMIIDNMGITLIGEANNIVSFPAGEVADLYASIDSLHIDIQTSSLREASLKGRIGLPISKADSIQNPLKYSAVLNLPLDSTQENSLQLVIEPTGPIYTNFLKGDMELSETSNIIATRYESGKKTFEMNLNGEFSWGNIKLGPINNVSFQLGFQNVGMDYNSTRTSDKLQFDIGNWSFASPQKFLANFPVTIDEIEFQTLPTTGNDVLRGKLKIPVIFNLSKKIGGASVLTVEGKIEDKSGSGGKKFHPAFVKAGVDSIAINADMAAVKIDGYIKFRDRDPVYGDGFIGELNADFKAGGIKIGALAEFGNTTYQNGNSRYRYWRVEADALFPAPGIVFLPGMAFRGFGGGAFKNMEASLTSNNTYSFEPKKSSLGFMAKAVLATTPKEQTFNADVGLLGQFSTSGGLSLISFTGDFYVGAGFNKRNKAKVKGNVGVSYDFPQKHFNLTANVSVNANPITTPSPSNLVLDINGKTNEWYFKFGEPNNLNTVKVFGINLYEYLMFGNKIPTPSGFTNQFNDAYYDAFDYPPNGSNVGNGGVGSNTETGKGFALGIGFMFDKSGDAVLTKYNNNNKKHTLYYALGAGAELNLAFMEYGATCNGYNPVGINGWRASGGLGFYGTASASVRKYKKNGSIKWNQNIASLKAGAWITGAFPNPYYVKGAIDGQISIFDLIEFSVHKEFEAGTSCGTLTPIGGATVMQGDAAADQEQLLIKYVNPQQSFHFPTTSPVIVKYGLTPDEVFDVSEQQSNGTVEMRTFKMVISKQLKSLNENTGTWSTPIYLTSSENNLGEYLYVAMAAQAGPSLSVNPNTMVLLNSSSNNTGSMAVAQNTMAGQLQFGNTQVAQQQQMPMFTYPSPPSSGGYSNLPPEPDPIVNTLTANVSYRFTVTATLKEWNGSQWVNALKNDGSPVAQTVVKNFRTGAPVLMSNTSNTSSQSK